MIQRGGKIKIAKFFKIPKARRIIEMLKYPVFIGSEIIPLLLDAIEQEKDISTKEKAIQYIRSVGDDDALSYLNSLDDQEYREMLDYVRNEI